MLSLISIDDLTKEDLQYIIDKSITIYNGDNLYPGLSNMASHIFAILFFEPSTRTKMSFESVIYRHNGKVLNYDHNTSSSLKGESFQDTIKTIDKYCDMFIIRHSDSFIFDNIQSLTNKPVINAGNGAYEHPTQAIIDATTIVNHFNVWNVNTNAPQILLVGDLSKSRTINSLIKCLHKLFPEIIFYLFFSSNKTDYMTWSNELHSYIIEKNITILPIHSYQEVIHHVDVVYITRPQTERHNIEYHDGLTITPQIIDQMKETAIVMHPLPRNKELPTSCDSNHRSQYFKQVEFSLPVRRVIIEYLMGYI